MVHDNRPLSPTLQIHRPQLTSVLSFAHRLTGIALSVGSLLLVAWLVADSTGPSAYQVLLGFLRSWLGLALLFGWTFACSCTSATASAIFAGMPFTASS